MRHEEFAHRADRPGVGSLEDEAADEGERAVAGVVPFDVEVKRHRRPPLGGDRGDRRPGAARQRHRGQERAHLHRYARAGAVLQHPFAHHHLGRQLGVELAAAHLDVGPAEQEGVVRVEHQLHAVNDAVVQDEAGDEGASGRIVEVANRPQLQLDVVGLGDVGVGLVEGPIGPRGLQPRQRRQHHDDREQNRPARRHDCGCEYTPADAPPRSVNAQGRNRVRSGKLRSAELFAGGFRNPPGFLCCSAGGRRNPLRVPVL